MEGEKKVRLTVVILTLNEERNLPYALESIRGWADAVFVLDSCSTDATMEIARSCGCHVTQNRFVDYARQRNHALDHLPVPTDWVLFLDADEWVPDELKREISDLIAANPTENGFYIKYRLIWMGRWVRRGYYPTWILRLFRAGRARCEERAINEHLAVEGRIGYLRNDFMHEDRKPLREWIAKQSGYASREAREAFQRDLRPSEINARIFGTQAERKRWIRVKIWNRLPPLIRPFFYFLYRYVIRGGFLDGKEAFVFHMLQGFWLQFMIDVYYLECRRSGDVPGKT